MVILYSKISQTLLDILAAVSEEPVYVQAFSSTQVLQRLWDYCLPTEICPDISIEEGIAQARLEIEQVLQGKVQYCKPLPISAAEYYRIPQKSMLQLRVVRIDQTRPLIRFLCSCPLIVRKIIKRLCTHYIEQDANIRVLEY